MDFIIEIKYKEQSLRYLLQLEEMKVILKTISSSKLQNFVIVFTALYLWLLLACHRTEVKQIPNDWSPAGPSPRNDCEMYLLIIRVQFCFRHYVAGECQQSKSISIQPKTCLFKSKCVLLVFFFGTKCNVVLS